MQTITPFLWFNDKAEEAAEFYVSIFGGTILSVSRYPDGAPNGLAGKALGVSWEVEGLQFQGLNAGEDRDFTEAISFFVQADTQERIDELWEKLTADGGSPGQCGWLKDRYGVSWQIVPARLGELLGDPVAGQPVMQAMLQMTKIVIADLEAAAA